MTMTRQEPQERAGGLWKEGSQLLVPLWGARTHLQSRDPFVSQLVLTAASEQEPGKLSAVMSVHI